MCRSRHFIVSTSSHVERAAIQTLKGTTQSSGDSMQLHCARSQTIPVMSNRRYLQECVAPISTGTGARGRTRLRTFPSKQLRRDGRRQKSRLRSRQRAERRIAHESCPTYVDDTTMCTTYSPKPSVGFSDDEIESTQLTENERRDAGTSF